MGCWPKNGLLDMNKGLSLQHIGRPHSGIGQSLHKSPWQLAQSPACMPQSPGKQRVSLSHSVAQPYGKFSSLAGGRRGGGWREEGRRLEVGGEEAGGRRAEGRRYGLGQIERTTQNISEETGIYVLGDSQVALDSECCPLFLLHSVFRDLGTCQPTHPPVELEEAV